MSTTLRGYAATLVSSAEDTVAVASATPAVAAAALRAGFAPRDVRAAAALWRSVSKLPVLKRATFSGPTQRAASLQFEFADPDAGKRFVMQLERPLTNPTTAEGQDAAWPSTPLIADGASAGSPWFPAPSRTKALRFTQIGDDWFAEVWGSSLQPLLRLNTKAVHGVPLLDASLQSVTWSDAEDQVAYVAERLKAKAPPLWNDAAEGPTTSRGAYESTSETWGEMYPDLAFTTVIHLSLPLRKAWDVLPAPFSDLRSAACPVLSASGSYVTFVAYAHQPRRLGIAHCTSRDSTLWTAPVLTASAAAAAVEEVKDHTFTRSVKCLARRPGTDAIALLVAAPGSHAHMTASSVLLLLPTAASGGDGRLAPVSWRRLELVPLVDLPNAATDDPFPGIYAIGGNSDVMWIDGEHLAVNSARFSDAVVYVIRVVDENPQPVVLIAPSVDSKTQKAVATGSGTWKAVDAFGGSLLITHSTTMAPPSLFVWRAASRDLVKVFDGSGLWPEELKPAMSGALPSAVWQVHAAETGAHRTEYWLHKAPLSPSSGADAAPLIVLLHGGPHGTDTAAFSRMQAAYLLAGFDIMSVNYGGSTGFGQRRIDELAGHVGTADVADCMSALRDAQKRGLVTTDAKHIAVCGGSHGGFLAAHIIGQYPDAFAAAAMRNPVTNLAALAFESDIPDWTAFESQCDTATALQKMFAMSPIAFASKVKTATLVGIGQADLRVPPAQARSWCHAVRANGLGADVRLLEYPGAGHAMDTVAAEADFTMMSLLFMAKYCTGSGDGAK